MRVAGHCPAQTWPVQTSGISISKVPIQGVQTQKLSGSHRARLGGHLSLEASIRPNLGTALFVGFPGGNGAARPGLVSDPAFGLQSVSQRLVMTRARTHPATDAHSRDGARSTTYFLTRLTM